MKTFDGYKKQALTDVYALLAGGGHKPLSEFSMAHTHPYLPLTGGTMQGALNFKNSTWNLMGDDVYIGDCNAAGMIGIKAANTTYPGITFFNNTSTHLGNLIAYSNNIKYGTYSLQFLDNGNTSVSAGAWMNPFSTYDTSAVTDGQAICVWGQSSYLSNLAADSGYMSLWLKRVSAKSATLNMVLDGEYYANGNQRLAHISEIPTSLKNPYALTISLNGISQGPYDGSAAKSINITPGSIGAATSGHNHDGRYVYNYGGAAMDANSLNKNALGMSNNSGITGDWWHILQASWNSEYRWNSQIAFPTQNKNGMYYRSGLDNNTAWGDWVKLLDVSNSYVTGGKGYINGTEITQVNNASKLQTARNLWGNSFDGIRDINGSIVFPAIGDTATSNKISWSGSSDGADIYYQTTATDQSNLVLNVKDNTNAYIQLALNGVFKSHFDVANSYWTGRSALADKWATARTFTIGNTAKNVDGSGNVSWSLAEIGVKDTWRAVQVNGTSIGNNTLNLCSSTYIGLTNVNGKVTFSLVGSGTTANQAILSNGTANEWTLKTLNIANWDAAYNLRHSHANKSVLDGITSGLVTNWNTAYTFVNTITGEDADKVINKWDEIVNFLAGITEDNKLNTLLNSKLSVYELANNTNVGTIKNNGIYYSTTDASSGTLTNSPFNTEFALINMTSYDGGDDLRRSRLAFNTYGEIKVSNDRDQANTAETWYNVLTSKNSGIDGSTIKLNGTSITVYSSTTADSRYVKKTGDTMSGALNFANNTWNQVGDDVAIGDHNVAGCLGIKGLTAGPGLAFYNSSNTLLSKLVGTANQFQRVSGNNTYNILDNSSTYISGNTITINGSSLTVSKSDHNHDNKYLKWLGNAGQSNMNAIGRISHSSGMTNLSDPGNTTDNPMEGSSKSTSWHLYWQTNYTDDPSGSNAWVAQIVNKAGTNRWWVRSRSGGTITNGNNWTSNWRFLVTAPTSGLGGSSRPIYINSAGEVVAANSYPTSLKNPHSLTLKANGTILATYDGSSAKEANFTYANIGAASSDHNHDNRYLQLTGGILRNNSIHSVITLNATNGSNDAWNKDGNAMLKFVSNNNAMVFSVGSPYNERTGFIQVGHADTDNYAQVTSSLHLNKLGGTVYINNNIAWHAGNDGSGSGLDADLLDGYHASAFALSSHTHSYLPLSGGIMTGDLTTTGIVSKWAFINTGDSTLKIYDGKITNQQSDGNICLQTSIDGTDGQSHTYPTQHGKRCNLVLQPRGGQVYIGTNPDGGNTNYKLYVNGNVYASSFTGNASSATKLTSSAGSATLPIYFSDGKPVACTAASVFSNLSNSGNNISVTVAGQNRTLTVAYASVSSKVESRGNLTAYEEGSTTKGESGINLYTVYNNGYPVNLGNLIHINGNGAGQLLAEWTGSTTLGHLYYRSKRDVDNSGWSAWGKIAYVTDNVASATKWATKHKITLTGSVTGEISLDGSEDVTLVTTTNHTHSYLPLSGGTITGNLILKGKTSADMTYADNIHPYIRFDNSDSSQNVSLIFTDYDTYRAPAGLKLVGSQGNAWFEAAKIYADTFYGTLSGNATTATALTTNAGSAVLPVYFNDGKPAACTPSSLFSNLSNSGNNISITVAGQNRVLTVKYADTVDGYHASNIMQAGWIGLLRTGGSSSTIKWTRIGRFITSVKDNTNNDAMIEFFANGDQNYTNFGYGRLMLSSYGTSSSNMMLTSVSDGNIHFYATIDADRYIWLGHNTWWSGNSKYRVLFTGSFVEWYSSSLTTQTTDPNDNYITDNGTLSTSSSNSSHAWTWQYNTRVSYATSANNASILKTKRTLWGQQFNGSANISGDMSNVGKISFSVLSGTDGRALLQQQMADSDFFRIYCGGTASNAGYAEIATADDGNEPIYVRQYTGVFSTLVRTLTLLDASGNTTFPGTTSSSGFIKSESNNNYVLLGGGGHKAISDFSTSGHTHAYLPLAGGTMNASARISHADGNMYLGRADNNGWVLCQNICSQNGSGDTYWSLKTDGTLHAISAIISGNVGISITSPKYKLHVNGDSFTTGLSRAVNGFYCESTGIYFTHNNQSTSVGEIDITSNNEFCWGSNNDTLYFNYRKVSKGTTVTNYIWNAGSSDTYASHTTGDITLGSNSNNNYQLKRAAYSSAWYNGRDNAIVRQTSASGYSVIMSSKTINGSWEIGNDDDDLCFTYITDSNYNSKNDDFLGLLQITSKGEVYSNNDIYATHFYENSDIRYKKILKNLSINSNIIANLPLFDFEWIENNTIGTGTSAQAVQQILPNLVSGTDKLTLDYGVLGTIAGITACKELVTQKFELQQLKEKVRQLEDRLRKYENI